MKLLAIAPWLTIKEVLAEMDFEPEIADPIGYMDPPTEEELDLLRVQLDPAGQSIAKGEWITF
jgi:glutaconate CoA-transferase subunit B